MDRIYNNVIFLGGSELIRNCIKKFFEKDRCGINVTFLDVEDGDLIKKQRLREKYNIEYRAVKRKSLTEYLVQVQEPSLVFSIMNNYILPGEVVANSNLHIINLHHSSLPGHRGMNAGAWSIFYGEEHSGITWHAVAEEVDKGKIIRVTRIPLTDDMTAIKLLRLQNAAAVKDFEELQEDFLEGKEELYEQPEGTDYLHKFHDVPAEGFLDLSWDGKKTSRFLRAMDFGILNVFGRPELKLDGTIYEWKKYIIEKPDDSSVMEDSVKVNRQDGKINIEIHKADGYIIRLIKAKATV